MVPQMLDRTLDPDDQHGMSCHDSVESFFCDGTIQCRFGHYAAAARIIQRNQAYEIVGVQQLRTMIETIAAMAVSDIKPKKMNKTISLNIERI
jgi:hypothetical protein